jgi:Domain of unknown function (DUF1330)
VFVTGRVLSPDLCARGRATGGVQSDISNMDQHAAYVKANRAVFGRYGATCLVRWASRTWLKDPRTRQVVIEFPTTPPRRGEDAPQP